VLADNPELNTGVARDFDHVTGCFEIRRDGLLHLHVFA